MKVERKGQGTGRKKNKRTASEALGGEGGEGEGPAKRPFLNEFRPKKVLKDKTGKFKAKQVGFLEKSIVKLYEYEY